MGLVIQDSGKSYCRKWGVTADTTFQGVYPYTPKTEPLLKNSLTIIEVAMIILW
jgi:hypothetical protein